MSSSLCSHWQHQCVHIGSAAGYGSVVRGRVFAAHALSAPRQHNRNLLCSRTCAQNYQSSPELPENVPQALVQPIRCALAACSTLH